MLGKRILTAFFLIPLFVGASLYLPPEWLIYLLAALAFIGGVEFSIMYFGRGPVSVLFFSAVTAASVYLACVTKGRYFPLISGGAFLLFSFLSLLGGEIAGNRGRAFFSQIVGFFYLYTFLPYASFVRDLPRGGWLLIFIAVTVYMGDTAAYFVGSRLGRIKLAPSISPGKTVEGAVASAIFGTLAGYAFLKYFYGLPTHFSYFLTALIVSTVGQGGDLLESLFKRTANVKDSGWLFPGHGGLLDRFDSFILNPFIVFFLMRGM